MLLQQQNIKIKYSFRYAIAILRWRTFLRKILYLSFFVDNTKNIGYNLFVKDVLCCSLTAQIILDAFVYINEV